MFEAFTSSRSIVGSLALLFVGGCHARVDVDDPPSPWDAGAAPSASTSEPETTLDDTAPSSTGNASEPTSSEDSTDGSEPERRWGPEIIIENTGANAKNVKVTMDAAGNVLFAWREHNDSARSAAVVTRYFSRRTGWGSIRRLAEYSEAWIGNLELCGNEDGSVVLTWTTTSRDSQRRGSLFAAYHSSGSGMVGPLQLEEEMSGPFVGCGIDESDLAMVAWGTSSGVAFSRGEGTNWTTPEVAVGASGSYRLAMNARGQAVLGGRHGSLPAQSLSIVWYDPNSGWGVPSSAPIAEPIEVSDYAVALGGDETAHLAWAVVLPDYTSQVWTSSFTTDGGWTTPFRLDEDGGSWGRVTLSANDSGSALAAWSSFTPFLERRVRARRFDPSAGWDVYPSFIGDHGTTVASTLGPTGHGLIAYVNTDYVNEGGSIEIVHMSPRGSRTTFVSHIPSEDSFDPAVAVNAAGQAVVAWEHFDGSSEARALFRD